MRLMFSIIYITSLMLCFQARFCLAGAEDAPAGLREVAHDDLFFIQTPHVVQMSADGVVDLAWRTRTAVPAGAVYFGPDMASFAGAGLRYRETAKEKLSAGEATDTHFAQIDLRTMLKGGAADIAGWSQSPQGTVQFRVEAWDPAVQQSRIWDGRFCFIKQEQALRAPCVVLGPFVANVTRNSAVIWFETDMPVDTGVVHAAKAGDQPGQYQSTGKGLRHQVPIGGLAPSTEYTYFVELKNAQDPGFRTSEFTFKTAPDPEGDLSRTVFRFAVMADSRASSGGQEQASNGLNAGAVAAMTRDARARGADFILFPGDMFNGYTTSRADYENQARSWLRAVEPVGREIPFYAAMGNHDTLQRWFDGGVFMDGAGENSSESAFSAMLVMPENGPPPERDGLPPYNETVYSFDYADAHFVTLNTEYWYTKTPELTPGNLRGHIMPGQLAWLDADLAAARARGVNTIFVMAHEPAFPNGGHVGDAMWYGGKNPEILAMRSRFLDILGKHGARAMFFAHEHNYSRTLVDADLHPGLAHDITQIISGSAGAPPVARDAGVPWAEKVQAFSTQESYVLVTVGGESGKISFTCIGPGGEILDQGDL